MTLKNISNRSTLTFGLSFIHSYFLHTQTILWFKKHHCNIFTLTFSSSFFFCPPVSLLLPCIYILPMLVTKCHLTLFCFLTSKIPLDDCSSTAEHGCTFFYDRHADVSISLSLSLISLLCYRYIFLLLLYTHM